MPPQIENQVVLEAQKKPILLLVLTAVMIVIGILSLWYLSFQKDRMRVVIENQNIVASSTPEISDWQTYRNEEYGFEFKYPEGFNVRIGNNSPLSMSFSGYNNGIKITAILLEESNIGFNIQSISNRYKTAFGNVDLKSRDIVLNGIPLLQFEVKIDGLDSVSLDNYFVLNQKIYSLSFLSQSNYIELANQILSTFKFISTSTVTSQLLKICPDEWILNKMPTVQDEKSVDSINPEYYILKGERKELEEFDTDWVMKNCNLKKQVVN